MYSTKLPVNLVICSIRSIVHPPLNLEEGHVSSFVYLNMLRWIQYILSSKLHILQITLLHEMLELIIFLVRQFLSSTCSIVDYEKHKC